MKPNILITGLSYSGGGLTNVMHNLIHYLKGSFTITCLAVTPDKKNNEEEKIDLFGCDTYIFRAKGSFFTIETEILETIIIRHNPICVITIGPLVFNRYLLLIFQKYRTKTKIISYIPVEGQLTDIIFLKYINLTDFCAFYTKSLQNDFIKLLLKNPIPENDFVTNKVSSIPHGVDKHTFYPLHPENDKERRKMARGKIYQDLTVSENTFIVLNMNRCYHRKRIDITIEGFKQFADGKENVLLHLHLGPATGNELEVCNNFIEKSGLGSKVIVTHGSGEINFKSGSWLNILYNACNVGISTSVGEGWGLGLFEHAATRAAIVAPCHTSFLENWENAALLMPWSEKQFVFYEYGDMFIVNPEEVCNALNKLYFDQNLLDKVSLDCFNRTQEARFDWANIAEKFRQIILKITS